MTRPRAKRSHGSGLASARSSVLREAKRYLEEVIAASRDPKIAREVIDLGISGSASELEGRPNAALLRAWHLACSTTERAYEWCTECGDRDLSRPRINPDLKTLDPLLGEQMAPLEREVLGAVVELVAGGEEMERRAILDLSLGVQLVPANG